MKTQTPLRVLVACEFSGIVREAFNSRGHNAWSCDILDTEIPGKHYQGKLEYFIGGGDDWDLIIAHPPCTYLTVSGARWFDDPGRREKQKEALAFVRMILLRNCPMICVENPVGVISTRIRKPDQIIQPWQFGHKESKKTCLWLKGLPELKPTKIMERRDRNLTPSGQNKLAPSADRWKDRSRTYKGIAEAMAEQWGNLSIETLWDLTRRGY